MTGKRRGRSRDEQSLVERFQSSCPLRVARLARDVSQAELAAQVGLIRLTITRLESGESSGSPESWRPLEAFFHMEAQSLERAMQVWRDSFNPLDFVRPNARAWLALPPEAVPATFASWVNWRQNVAGSSGATAFVLGIHEATIRKWESSKDGMPMPRSLISSLSQRLGLSAEYIRQLIMMPRRGGGLRSGTQSPAGTPKRGPVPDFDYPWNR